MVEIILALKNVAQFVSGADQASKAMGGLGNASEKSGKQAGIGWKGIAKWAGGAAAIAGGTKLVKDAISGTTDLAKSTVALQRQTNLDTQTASEWVGVLKERNVSTAQFQVGLKTLSKAMETSRTGTIKQTQTVAALRKQIDEVSAAGGKKAPAQIAKLSNAILKAQQSGDKARSALDALGVSQADIAKGDTKDVILQVADSLSKMTNPAERSTAAQKLFGRTGIALLPVLLKGRKGIEDLLDEQKKYGNYLSDKGAKNAQDLIKKQRSLNAAWSGAKVQLGQALLPVLLSLARVLLRVVNALDPLLRNATLMKVLIGTLAGLFIAYKAALVVATIQQLEFDAAASANPIGAIVLGITALIAVSVLLVKHWGTVKAVFMDVWNWIKTNWPLLGAILLGPFAVAVLEIVKHFDAIKAAAGTVAGAIESAWKSVGGAIKDAINWLIKGWNSLHFKMPSVNTHIPGVGKIGGWTVGVTPIPELAAGGLIRNAGLALVGERGPELVSLPGGAIVHPAQPELTPATSSPYAGAPLVIEVPVVLDGREIARSTARVTADRLARR